MKKLKKASLLMALSCTCIAGANAATILINNVEPQDNPISGFTVTAATVGLNAVFSFTQTGDLDGEGISNDTLSFDLVSGRHQSDSTFDGTDVTLGTQLTAIATGRNFGAGTINTNQSVTFSIQNVVYTDGEGNETVVFTGFTNIGTIQVASTTDGDNDFYIGLLGATTIAHDTSGTLDLTSNGAATDIAITTTTNLRFRDLDFAFETVPEPSSTALLVLGGLALLLRRRRA